MYHHSGPPKHVTHGFLILSNLRLVLAFTAIICLVSAVFVGTALMGRRLGLSHHHHHHQPYALVAMLAAEPPSWYFHAPYTYCFPTAPSNERVCDIFTPVAIFDSFYSCDRSALYVIARPIKGQNFDVTKIRARLIYVENENGTSTEINLLWAVRTAYESVAAGVWRGILPPGPGGCDAGPGHEHKYTVSVSESTPRRRFSISIEYGPSNRWSGERALDVIPHAIPLRDWRHLARRTDTENTSTAFALPRSLPPARAPVGLCTTLVRSSASLRFFIEYYTALGVGAFYLYAIAPNATHEFASSVARILRTVRTSAAITVVPWPYDLVIPYDRNDPNYSQSPALNSCASRYGGSVDSLVFVDVDEFLILSRAPTLPALAAWARTQPLPIDELVTHMAWALVGVTPAHVSALRGAFEPWRALPRAPPNRTLVAPPNRALNCSSWHDGPQGDGRPHDDDDRSLGWGVNETALEHECFAAAGEASPSAWPSPLPAIHGEPSWRQKLAAPSEANRRAAPRFVAPSRAPPPLLGTPLSRLSFDALVGPAPPRISRTAVISSGREKYIVTHTPALFPPSGPPVLVNVHGVYEWTDTAHERRLDESEAYHCHLLNSDDPDAAAPRITSFLLNFRAKLPWFKAAKFTWGINQQSDISPQELQEDTLFITGVQDAIRVRVGLAS